MLPVLPRRAAHVRQLAVGKARVAHQDNVEHLVALSPYYLPLPHLVLPHDRLQLRHLRRRAGVRVAGVWKVSVGCPGGVWEVWENFGPYRVSSGNLVEGAA